MKNKKGFTLLELLIAATIIGILTVMATVSYRNSGADVRVAGAKARTDMLAGAVQRFRLDHPNVTMSGALNNLSGTTSCSINATTATKMLIACDYLEDGGWLDDYFIFYVCSGNETPDGDCKNQNGSDVVGTPLACMKGRDHPRLPNHYHSSKGYIYCVSADSKGENLGSED